MSQVELPRALFSASTLGAHGVRVIIKTLNEFVPPWLWIGLVQLCTSLFVKRTHTLTIQSLSASRACKMAYIGRRSRIWPNHSSGSNSRSYFKSCSRAKIASIVRVRLVGKCTSDLFELCGTFFPLALACVRARSLVVSQFSAMINASVYTCAQKSRANTRARARTNRDYPNLKPLKHISNEYIKYCITQNVCSMCECAHVW